MCRPNCNAYKDVDSINNKSTEMKTATLLPTFQWFENIVVIIYGAMFSGNNNR